jgi:hypothetical protein
MKLFRSILGYRDFNKLNSIKDFLVSRNLVTSREVDSLKHIMLFNTSKQRTWLLADNEFVYCFLDDTTKDSFEFRWKETKSNLKGKIIVNPNVKPKVGIVDFGQNHKRWYYSKDLYSSESEVLRGINELLK